MQQTFGIQACDFSADGRLVLLSGSEGQLQAWDAKAGEPISPEIHCGQPHTQCLFASGEAAIIALSNASLSIEIIRGASAVTPAAQAPSGVSPGEPLIREWLRDLWRCSISRDGRRAAVRGDGFVRLWDIDKDEPVGPRLPQGGLSRYAEFSPDADRLVTAGDFGLVRVWDLTRGLELGTSPVCWRQSLVPALQGSQRRPWHLRTRRSDVSFRS